MASLPLYFSPKFFDGAVPAAGYSLHTFEAGTTTPKATYTTSVGDVANANPIILDSDGTAPSGLYLGSGSYTFRLNRTVALGSGVVDTWVVNSQAGYGTGTVSDALDDAWISETAGGVTSVTQRDGGDADNAWFMRRAFGTIAISTGAGADGFSYSPRSYMWDTSENADCGSDFFVGAQFRMRTGGTNSKGGRIGLYSTIEQATPSAAANAQRNYPAIQGSVYTTLGDGGTDTGAGAKGAYFGLAGAAYAAAGAVNIYNLSGGEFNTFVTAGATVKYQFGLQIACANATRGAGFDAAIGISGLADAITHAGYGVGILFHSANGAEPFSGTSTMIAAVDNSGLASMQHAIDVSSYTVTGKLLKGKRSSLSESVLSLGDSGGNGIIDMADAATANSNLLLRGKGTGSVYLQGADGVNAFRADRIASAVNYVAVAGAITTGPPIISAVGSDTNIDLQLTGKGTGVLRFGTHSALAAETVTGYITIKDAGGTSRKVAVVS